MNHFPISMFDHDLYTFLKTMAFQPSMLQLAGALPECWHLAFGRLTIGQINLQGSMNGSEWIDGFPIVPTEVFFYVGSHMDSINKKLPKVSETYLLSCEENFVNKKRSLKLNKRMLLYKKGGCTYEIVLIPNLIFLFTWLVLIASVS